MRGCLVYTIGDYSGDAYTKVLITGFETSEQTSVAGGGQSPEGSQ